MKSVVLEGFPDADDYPSAGQCLNKTLPSADLKDRIFPLHDRSTELRFPKWDAGVAFPRELAEKSAEEIEAFTSSHSKEDYVFKDSGETRAFADRHIIVNIFRFAGIQPRKKMV